MVTQTIVLPEPQRYFERSGGQLSQTGQKVPANIRLEVGQIISAIYDHRDQEAVPFRYLGKTFYLLLDEILVPRLRERLRRFSGLRLVVPQAVEKVSSTQDPQARRKRAVRLRLVSALVR